MSGSFVNENEHFFYMLHKHIVNCCYFDFIENLNISLRWNMMNYNKSYRLLCRVIFSVIIIISTFQITHPSCLPPNLYTSNLFPCSNVSDVSLNILLLLILPFAFRKTTNKTWPWHACICAFYHWSKTTWLGLNCFIWEMRYCGQELIRLKMLLKFWMQCSSQPSICLQCFLTVQNAFKFIIGKVYDSFEEERESKGNVTLEWCWYPSM